MSIKDNLNKVGMHDYKDHANDDEAQFREDAKCKATHSSDRNFPIKLHYMLSELQNDGQDHIVGWSPHGRSFVVHDQEEFVRSILPMWFRQSKFASFQRQLNLYGFKRLTTGRDKKAYYHELFLRSRRFLCHGIPRIKLKGTGSRKPTPPDTQPNFYLMPYLPMEKEDKMAKVHISHNNSNFAIPHINSMLLGPLVDTTQSNFERMIHASATTSPTMLPLELAMLREFMDNPVLAAARANAIAMPPTTSGFVGNDRYSWSSLLQQQTSPPQELGNLLVNRDIALRLALARANSTVHDTQACGEGQYGAYQSGDGRASSPSV